MYYNNKEFFWHLRFLWWNCMKNSSKQRGRKMLRWIRRDTVRLVCVYIYYYYRCTKFENRIFQGHSRKFHADPFPDYTALGPVSWFTKVHPLNQSLNNWGNSVVGSGCKSTLKYFQFRGFSSGNAPGTTEDVNQHGLEGKATFPNFLQCLVPESTNTVCP